MKTGRPIGQYRDDRIEKDGGRGLAPDDPTAGLGCADPGLCLFLISPGGAAPEIGAAAALPATDPGRGAETAQLVERWVRRVALGGDSRRGVARLDIGGGRYSGAELLVTAEAHHVSVKLSLNGAEADEGLARRLRTGLEAKGYAVDVDVG